MTSRSWSAWGYFRVSISVIIYSPSNYNWLFLKFAGLDKGECTAENIERIKAWVPPNLAKYVEGMEA